MMTTALLLLALLGLFYVLAPLQFLATHRQARVETDPVPVDQAPPAVAGALEEWRSAFGDAAPALVAVHALAGGVAHVLHLVERDSGVHGLDYLTPAGRWQVFLTRYVDGQEVVTTNYPLGVTLAPHPRVHAVRDPGTRDLRRLRALHRAHAGRAVSTYARVQVPHLPDLADFVAEHELRTVERQCELGAMVCENGVYRPTARGAFAAVWRRLPPLRWMHGARDARLVRELRADIR